MKTAISAVLLEDHALAECRSSEIEASMVHSLESLLEGAIMSEPDTTGLLNKLTVHPQVGGGIDLSWECLERILEQY